MLMHLLDWFLLGHNWHFGLMTKNAKLSLALYASMSVEHQRAIFGSVQILLICRRCGKCRKQELLGEKVDIAAYIAEKMQ